MREKENDKPEFDLNDRGFNVKCWYVKNTEKSRGDALVEIRKDGELIREFIYPAYKIYNIAAHFSDIVDSEIEKNFDGYKAAGSTGLGGHVMPQPVDNQP